MRKRLLVIPGAILAVCLSVPSAFAAASQAAIQAPPDPLHAWVGLNNGDSLATWVNWHIAEEKRLVADMLAVHGPRTVPNTLALFDDAQTHLALAANQTNIMFSTHANKAIRDRAQALIQVISTEYTILSLNQDVYKALLAVDVSAASAATQHYMARTLLEYRLGGVDKDDATRARVRKLEDEQTTLALKFGRNTDDDVRKVRVHDVAELNGLPEDYIARHKPAADGVITLTTDAPDMTPVMSYATNSALRREMYLAYNNRAHPANDPILLNLLGVRQELATTLGFDRWADLATSDMMIGSAANMKAFLNQVDEASRSRADREFKLTLAFAKEKDPTVEGLTQSDSAYWDEQYRRAKYDFDSQSVRPYFAYETVESGVLKTASRLFHIEFRAVKDAPVWDPAVHAYDVYDGGQKAGRIYLDMHPREGKDKWFSEAPLIPGQRGRQLPETTLVCNFPGGSNGDPGLMEFGSVVTYFHEFGHMMHEVLGGKQEWAGQSGVQTEGDFNEAPSQMLEEMFHDPAVLQSFAKHYKTGETLPSETIERMNRASYFGRASAIRRQLFYSAFALQVHDEDPAKVDFNALWKQDSARFSPYKPVDGVHMYSSFGHLVGLTSNYYTYVLDKVIAVDFFAQFDPHNILDGPTALRYRKTVLEPGGSRPAAELIKDFLGRPQNIDALEKWMDREFEPPAPSTAAR